MAMSSRVWIWSALLSALVLFSSSRLRRVVDAVEEAREVSHVLTLDASNFDETVSKHPFIVVEFYAPWCGHCKKLEPEYEKAAAVLSQHDPPIVLAKVDANEQANKGLASKYEVNGYPTIKILKNGGKNIQAYKGPREADGIIEFLKKQAGPASVEIKSAEDANKFIDEKKVFIVGIFPEFSGEEFSNFINVTEKLRSDYDFGHTLEAKFLPKGESAISWPVIRILKPFDELFADSKDFNVDALEKFIEEASMPLVTLFNKDPSNHPYVVKFFGNANAKAMLFMNFSSESSEKFKSKMREAAENYKSDKISFLLGDIDASPVAFQYFGVREDQVPLMIILKTDGQKYLKVNLDPLDIADWLKDYMDGKLKPYRKSEPIPEVNNEPVKVVVADSLNDVVLESGKNVLLEFYAPWCGHCQKLAPILDEVAISLESDPSIIIAKLDATANDIPSEFELQGYPTLYFLSATGKHVQYNGSRTKGDIIEFIQKNKEPTLKSDSKQKDAVLQPDAIKTDTVKDEL